MAKIRGVLLDVDGTLVDSNDAHARAWVEALAEVGLRVDFPKVRSLIGMGGDKLLPRVTRIGADTPAGKKIVARRKQLFLERYLPAVRAFPRARDLLQHMHERDLQLVVATSAQEDELKALLQICGADKLIDAKTSSDEAERSKPD